MVDAKAEITVARSEDVRRLSAIATATFLETFADMIVFEDIALRAEREDSPGAFRARLDAGASAWLATMGSTGSPVGFALLTTPELPEVETGENDLELKRIYLLHRFHGSGVGRSLYEAVEIEARERGAKRLLLGVYEGNAAVAWYRRQGFYTIGTRSFRVGNAHFSDLIMAKSMSI